MSDQDESDKTHFKPKQTPAEKNADDRTTFVQRNAKPASDDNQKTQLKSPQENPAKPQQKSVDQTVANAKVSDKTQVIKKSPVPPPVPEDKTRFIPPKKTVQGEKTLLASEGERTAPKLNEVKPTSEYGILKNRFVFEEVLGAGGMGVVYKAKDLLKIEAQDREPYVAIKVLSAEFKAHPEAFIALQRESRKTQKIAHPNIVNVHDFDRDGDQVFMTMEYMEGRPLDKYISQHRSIGVPVDDAIKIIEGISAALIYAHGQNIIHSDFKPGNIFVSDKGHAKVFDFGIARAVAKAEHREESKDDRTVFDAGNLGALTPAYASLEMLEGETPDVRDDIYALGCIAYELFTGEHPYNRMHADEAKRQKVKPKKITNISKQQWRAIEHALAFKREDRTETVEDFWREFNQKASNAGKITLLIFLLIALAGGAYYKFVPEEKVGLSEDEVKSQIEKKLRLEYQMKSLVDLYKSAEFSPGWEAQVWTEFQALRDALGKTDEWIVNIETEIYALYVKKISDVITAGNLKFAKELIPNAARYSTNTQKLTEYETLIAKLLDDKKRADEEALRRQQQVVVQPQPTEKPAVVKESETLAQKKSLFDAALNNVNTQLECRANLDMKDFDIAITKLRSIDLPRYQSTEPVITKSLAQCIEKIGSSFPERAEESKKYALRLFKDNPVILAIRIVVKDQCSLALAGLGSRGMGSTCRDKLSGASKAPVMVVIPAKGSVKAFALGKYEVSVDELNEYCQVSKSCEQSSAEGTLPATNLSTSTVTSYLRWLSEKSGRQYRLPSTVEWQYAAKAETGRADPNRNCKLNSRGIQKGNSLIKASVGQQNPWGVVNYLGNARELVSDSGGRYVAVGGSYETPMEDCEVTASSAFDGQPDGQTGFRVLREISN